MSSVQERLQLKRVPMDKWSIKEQLCLASAVACSGDQNWMSVSRALKMLCQSNRPSDWFAQRSCAAQYGKLLENVETPKRKKRTISERDNATVETPGEMILKKLTQERIVELKKTILEEQQEYMKLNDDILLVQSTNDENILTEMWNQIEMENKQKEKEHYHHSLWLKEREEKKLEMEKQWKPTSFTNLNQGMSGGTSSQCNSPVQQIKIKSEDSNDSDLTPLQIIATKQVNKQGTSPLLTSLLKSPSTTSTATAPVNVQTTTSGNQLSQAVRNLAPTISNLLTTNIIPGQNTISISNSDINPSKNQSQNINFQSQKSTIESDKVSSIAMNIIEKNLSINQLKSEDSVKQEIIPFTDLTGDSQSPAENDSNKEDDQHLLDVFNGLIPDNIDELADILTENNAIILSPELLEEESILENVEDLIGDSEEIDELETKAKDEKTNLKNEKGENFSLVNKSNNEEVKNEINSKNDEDFIGKPIKIDKKDESEMEIINPLEKQNLEVKMELDENHEESTVTTQIDTIIKKEDPDIEIKDDKEFSVKFEKHEKDDVELIKSETNENSLIDNADEIIEIPDDTSNTGSVKIEIIDDDDDVLEESHKIEDKENKKESQTVSSTDDIKSSTDEEPKQKLDQESSKVSNDDDNNSKDLSYDISKQDDGKDSDSVEIIKSNQSSVEQNVSSDDDNSSEVQNVDENEKVGDGNESAISETQLISLIDTDDDSPMEVIKEDKSGKMKRDYSRKKTESTETNENPVVNIKKCDEVSEDKTLLPSVLKLKERDRSESPLNLDDDNDDSLVKLRHSRYSSTATTDSIPNSPASSDDKEYKALKKAILVVYNRLTSHKFASIFYKIEDNYYNYRNIIYRPLDLNSIKRNIDSGIIKTTTEFQRDIMLMCQNVLMLNDSRNINSNYSIAKEFMDDAISIMDSAFEGWRKEDKLQGLTVIAKHMRSGRKCSRISNI